MKGSGWDQDSWVCWSRRYRGGRLAGECYRGGRLELTCWGMVAALVNHKDRVVLTSHLAYFSTTTGSGMGRT